MSRRLEDASTEELRRELERRGEREPERRCTGCRGKWPVEVKAYSTFYPSPHCVGCNRPEPRCTC